MLKTKKETILVFYMCNVTNCILFDHTNVGPEQLVGMTLNRHQAFDEEQSQVDFKDEDAGETLRNIQRNLEGLTMGICGKDRGGFSLDIETYYLGSFLIHYIVAATDHDSGMLSPGLCGLSLLLVLFVFPNHLYVPICIMQV